MLCTLWFPSRSQPQNHCFFSSGSRVKLQIWDTAGQERCVPFCPVVDSWESSWQWRVRFQRFSPQRLFSDALLKTVCHLCSAVLAFVDVLPA